MKTHLRVTLLIVAVASGALVLPVVADFAAPKTAWVLGATSQ